MGQAKINAATQQKMVNTALTIIAVLAHRNGGSITVTHKDILEVQTMKLSEDMNDERVVYTVTELQHKPQ